MPRSWREAKYEIAQLDVHNGTVSSISRSDPSHTGTRATWHTDRAMPSPLTQYWLIASYWFAHFLPRLSLPVIIPLIAGDLGVSVEARARLLSGFFQG